MDLYANTVEISCVALKIPCSFLLSPLFPWRWTFSLDTIFGGSTVSHQGPLCRSPHPSWGILRTFFVNVFVNGSTVVSPTRPRAPGPAQRGAGGRPRCPSPGASAPADRSAERAHHATHRKPQRGRQDEGHDHLHHRRACPGRGRQNDRRQGMGTTRAGNRVGAGVRGLQPPLVPLPGGGGTLFLAAALLPPPSLRLSPGEQWEEPSHGRAAPQQDSGGGSTGVDVGPGGGTEGLPGRVWLLRTAASCRWRAPRPSPGSPSSGTAGMKRSSTALPTSVTPKSSTPTNTWATRRGSSSPHSRTGEGERQLPSTGGRAASPGCRVLTGSLRR